MPYFHWVGVELTGSTKKGTLFARSSDHLDELLFKRNIALLRTKPVRQLWKKRIRLSHVMQFFRQLSVLIDAGILLPNALSIVGDQISHPPLQEVIHDIAQRVKQGDSWSVAIGHYPKIFSHIMAQLIKGGEESGKLAQSVDAICVYGSSREDFRARVRAALMIPLVTLAFFVIIAGVIVGVVLPRFVDIFKSMNQAIPPAVERMLAIQTFITSFSMVVLIVTLGMCSFVWWYLYKRTALKGFVDRVVLRLPFIGSLLQDRLLGYTFQTAALLIQSGMPVLQAFETVRASVRNREHMRYLSLIELEISSGSSLSDAMARYLGVLFTPDVIAMVEVGQESGRLGLILSKVAHLYHDRITTTLVIITMILQPVLMLMLGLLVTMLVFSVYGPLVTMSSAF